MENFFLVLNGSYRLSEILISLFTDEKGRVQLIEAGFLPKGFQLEEAKDVRMRNGEGTAGEGTAEEDFENMFIEGRRRRDQSSEEEHIRRRHREAMVLNDGTRPLGRDDIIQRERSFHQTGDEI